MVVLVVGVRVLCVVMVGMMVLVVGARVLEVVFGKIHFRFFKTKKHGLGTLPDETRSRAPCMYMHSYTITHLYFNMHGHALMHVYAFMPRPQCMYMHIPLHICILYVYGHALMYICVHV